MMLKKWFQDLLSERYSFVLRIILDVIGAIAGITAIVAFLGLGGNKVVQFIVSVWKSAIQYLEIADVPRSIWVLFFSVVLLLWFIWRRLALVAGSFRDNFNHGLLNWEYGGEGWHTQRGEKGYELSLTNSSDGGITNFGFGWDNYEFSFGCKLLNRNVGWIVRAADRENYVMIQLSYTKGDITINPHYRVRSGWFVLQQKLHGSPQLIQAIQSQQWLDIRIVVLGNTIDTFINGERVLNHHIPDPLRYVSERTKAEWKANEAATEQQGEKELISISYPSGRVGFRCFGKEHALIRNVRVRPLVWNSKFLK